MALRQVAEGLAILHAVDHGALLAEPPPGHEARQRHQAAVVLIELLKGKLERLKTDLERRLSMHGASVSPASPL